MQRCEFRACHWLSGIMIATVTACDGGEHGAEAARATMPRDTNKVKGHCVHGVL